MVVIMDLSKEEFDKLYNQLPPEVKKEAMHYIEFLIQKLQTPPTEDVYDRLLKCAGKITPEQAENMISYVKESREEWDE